MKTVFVSGCFNVLHPGHLRLLRFAKECGDKLIVGVESDLVAGSNAHIPESLRLEGVLANSFVDSAFIYNENISNLILRIRPDIVVKGKEHYGKDNLEVEPLKAVGGKLIFSSGESIFSSMDLLRREFYADETDSIEVPRDYLNRHSIDREKLINLVKKFPELHICVVGDLIIDEYITCQSLGMSQEDPTIVVTPIDKTRFIGGAAIVASHAAAMGSNADFISVLGVDDIAEYAKEALEQNRLKTLLLIDESRPTTLKQRYRSKGKTLLRVSHLHQHSISDSLKNRIYNYIEENIKKYDLIVFSDFNYGCLPQDLVDRIIKLAKSNDVFLAADSQSSSQFGDIGRFKQVNLVSCTEHEARVSLKNNDDGLVVLADKLGNATNCNHLFLKLGEEGVLVHIGNADSGSWETDRVPALNVRPKDVSGAGDSLLISSAMAMALGATIWEAAALGSLAAAIQVGRLGNTKISSDELINKILQ